MRYENIDQVINITKSIKEHEELLSKLERCRGAELTDTMGYRILIRVVFDQSVNNDFIGKALENAVEQIKNGLRSEIEALKTQLLDL